MIKFMNFVIVTLKTSLKFKACAWISIIQVIKHESEIIRSEKKCDNNNLVQHIQLKAECVAAVFSTVPIIKCITRLYNFEKENCFAFGAYRKFVWFRRKTRE